MFTTCDHFRTIIQQHAMSQLVGYSGVSHPTRHIICQVIVRDEYAVGEVQLCM